MGLPHCLQAVHSPQAPPFLKATVAAVEQRQDGEGAGGADLLESGLGKVPTWEQVLRIEQIPMKDSVRFRGSAQSRWPFIHV